jgi:hypothetical protein
MVTLVPTLPSAGMNDVMVGTLATVKLPLLLPVPPEVVIVIGPVVALDGTVAVICDAEFTVKLAEAPLNDTEVAQPKFIP